MKAHRLSWRPALPLTLGILVLVLMAMSVLGENTPPSVEVQSPEEGSALGLSVTVSGKATDVEGFNIESFVEARWNDWEWFLLPNTPADGGMSIVFGEMVNLDWHAPGDHLLQVRAFDGELFSEVALVNVTVRDLPDLVILPTDIELDPEDAEGGDTAVVRVRVQNQGGEEVPDVEVVLIANGEEVADTVMDLVDANSEVTVSFKVELEDGNNTMRVSAFSLRQVEERSLSNNEAERSFDIPPPDVTGDNWLLLQFVLGAIVLVVALILVAFWVYAVVMSRKD